ncbi:hypothetical protein ABZ667_08400 [Streptomyces lavendulae]|uniref:hypothetical protein n=1 Tax=Streptomyces lavendulae TaxID=1914 RepID=UPI0033C87149
MATAFTARPGVCLTAPPRSAAQTATAAVQRQKQVHACRQTQDAGMRFHGVRDFSDNLERNGEHEGHRDDGARERPGSNAVDWS